MSMMLYVFAILVFINIIHSGSCFKNQHLNIFSSLPIVVNEDDVMKERFCTTNRLLSQYEQFHVIKDLNEYTSGQYAINVVMEAPLNFRGKIFLFLVSDQSRKWSVEFKGRLNNIQHIIFISASSELLSISKSWNHTVFVMDRTLHAIPVVFKTVGRIFHDKVATVSVRYVSNYIRITIPKNYTNLKSECNFMESSPFIYASLKSSRKLNFVRSSLHNAIGASTLNNSWQICTNRMNRNFLDFDFPDNIKCKLLYRLHKNKRFYTVTFLFVENEKWGNLTSNSTVYYVIETFEITEYKLMVRIVDKVFEDLSNHVKYRCYNDTIIVSIDRNVLTRYDLNINQLSLRSPHCKFVLNNNGSMWTIKMKGKYSCGFLSPLGTKIYNNVLLFNTKPRSNGLLFTHYMFQTKKGILSGSPSARERRRPLMIPMQMTEGFPVKYIGCGPADSIRIPNIGVELSFLNNFGESISQVSYREPFDLIVHSPYKEFRLDECTLSLYTFCQRNETSNQSDYHVTEHSSEVLTIKPKMVHKTKFWTANLTFCSPKMYMLRVIPTLDKDNIYGLVVMCRVKHCDSQDVTSKHPNFCPLELAESPIRCSVPQLYYSPVLSILDETVSLTLAILLPVISFFAALIFPFLLSSYRNIQAEIYYRRNEITVGIKAIGLSKHDIE